MPFPPAQMLRDWFNDLFGVTSEETWRKYMPISEDEAKKILLQDMPQDTIVKITLGTDGIGSLAISHDEVNDNRSFSMEQKVVDNGMMHTNTNGAGLGRKLMRNEIEFFAACGIQHFNIQAGSSAGGYAWARFGFLPKGTPENFIDKARNRYERIQPLLTTEEQQTVEDILEFKNPQDMWRLADMKTDLAPRLRDIFRKAAAGNATAANQKDRMFSVIKQYKREGTEMPIGRVLMAGNKWEGTLDFANKEQMDRIEKYVGGWKSGHMRALQMARTTS